MQDQGVTCRAFVAFVLWRLGYPDQAQQRCHEALTLARDLSHAWTLAASLSWSAMFYRQLRQAPVVQEWAEAAITLATEQGFPFWVAQGTFYRGWALGMQGQVEEGMRQMRQGKAALQATGVGTRRLRYLAMLAEVCGKTGQAVEGLEVLAEAEAVAVTAEERESGVELYCAKGEILLAQSSSNQSEAETCFQQALSVAQNQSAKSWELRAATSLAKLWQSQDKRKDAYDLLAPVYNWFTEGFDTLDLKDAKSLLDELS